LTAGSANFNGAVREARSAANVDRARLHALRVTLPPIVTPSVARAGKVRAPSTFPSPPRQLALPLDAPLQFAPLTTK
jgi:hypothetical protein